MAMWGVATGLKLFPGMWLLGLAGRRERRLAIGGMALAMSLIAIGGVIVGLTNVTQFAREVVPSSSRWYGTLGNYSLLSVGSAFSGRWLGWLLVGGAVVILVPLYLRRTSCPDQIYVSGTALALLLSPLAWLNYLVLVIPALVILSDSFDLGDNPRHRLGFATLVVTLCGWGPVVTGSEPVSNFLSFIPTYSLIALFFVAQSRLKGASWAVHIGDDAARW